jgi:ABC-type transport system involved in cytochrome c biogenesis permease component
MWKDARVEWRGKQALQAGVVLVLLFFVLDLFAFPTLRSEHRAAAAVVWTPILYATAALCGRGLATEADRGTLALLRSAPVPLLLHGIARTATNLAVALALAALTLGAAAALFSITLSATVLAAVGLGTLGLVVLGTLASGLAAQASSRDILLPILLVPLAAPILQAGLHATLAGLDGVTWSGASGSLLALAGYDFVVTGAAILLWPLLLEE